MTTSKTFQLFNQTLFVIGAGSNKPFSFPTGLELKSEILYLLRLLGSFHSSEYMHYSDEEGFNRARRSEYLEFCKQFNPTYKNKYEIDFKDVQSLDGLLRELKINYSDLLEIEKLFIKSQVNSIDSFLQSGILNNEQRRLLTCIIIFIIRKHEIDNRYVFYTEHWLNFFFNQLLGTNDLTGSIRREFLARPPTFLTFNYDRFLEYQLYHYFKLKDFNDNEILEMIKKSVFHVYGSLGEFNVTEYETSDIDFDLVRNNDLISTIRSTTLDKYVCQLGQSDFNEVLFMGFGFDTINYKLVLKECYGKLYQGLIFLTNFGNDQIVDFRLTKFMSENQKDAVNRAMPGVGTNIDLIRNYVLRKLHKLK